MAVEILESFAGHNMFQERSIADGPSQIESDDQSAVVMRKPSIHRLPSQQRLHATASIDAAGCCIKKFHCHVEACGKSFTTSGHLARHNRIHTGERRFQCPVTECAARFSRHDNLTTHIKTHDNKARLSRRCSSRTATSCASDHEDHPLPSLTSSESVDNLQRTLSSSSRHLEYISERVPEEQPTSLFNQILSTPEESDLSFAPFCALEDDFSWQYIFNQWPSNLAQDDFSFDLLESQLFVSSSNEL